jgi:predicted nucleic acid-binding protein
MSDPAPDVLVVDSSVAVKWFLSDREALVDRAWALLQSHLDERIRLTAPEHLRLEVLNALLQRGLSADGLTRATAALDGFRLKWHRVDGSLAESAVVIAATRGLTLYDAAFTALALELDAVLVTADRRLAASGACRARLLGE